MQIPPFKISVLFESGAGLLVTEDVLSMCEFTEEGLSASQGDTKLLVSLPLVIGQIQR
jgi:hypothetical protein